MKSKNKTNINKESTSFTKFSVEESKLIIKATKTISLPKKKAKKIYNYFIIITILLLISVIILIILNEFNKSIRNKNTKKEASVAICAIGKNENLYINEWIDHYEKLGIKKIMLYDNNDIDGEKFNDVINIKYIKSKFIEIFNVRGKKKYQKYSYMDCLKSITNKYDWILIVDLDEYLILNESLYDFTNSARYNNCDLIKINWLTLNDNNQLYYKNELLKVRLNQTAKCHKERDKASKVFVRGKKNVQWKGGAHTTKDVDKERVCNTKANIVDNEWTTPNITYDYAHIIHYAFKSTEEFINKIKRGDSLLRKSDDLLFINFITQYFDCNDITKEKIEMLEKNFIEKKEVLKVFMKKYYNYVY